MAAPTELNVQPMSRLFKALGDPTRLRIVALLAHGELCVCHFQEALGLSQPNVSQQLGVLRSAGVVESRREGCWIYYKLSPQPDAECERQLRQLAETVQAQPKDSIVIVVGDFNIPRGSGLYRNFLLHSGLTDLLAGDHRPTLRMPFKAASSISLSIDYILAQVPEKYSFKIDCENCFTERYTIGNRMQGYLSDHHGIEVRLTRDS